MRKKIFFLIFLGLVLGFIGKMVFAHQKIENPQPQIWKREKEIKLENPAAIFCKEKGYRYEIRRNENGKEFGVCIFPDGRECEEWAFYKKECGLSYSIKESIKKERMDKEERTERPVQIEKKRMVEFKKDEGREKKFPEREERIRPQKIEISPVSPQICALNNEDIKEIQRLFEIKAELEKLHSSKEKAKQIDKKIEKLKKKIELKKRECERRLKTRIKKPEKAVIKKEMVKEKFCRMLEKIDRKIYYYKNLLNLSPQELKEKGYQIKEIEKILRYLRKEKEKAILICTGKKVLKKDETIIKPVVPEKTNEVANYYKEKFAKVIEKEMPIEEKIKVLTDLRNEIDEMIKELIRTKNEFSLKEVQPFMKKITFSPGRIRVSKKEELKIQEEKKIEAKVNNRKIKLIVGKEKLILEEKGIKTETALPLELKEEKLLTKGKEIKLTPSKMIERVKIKNPISFEINLVENKEKPVYEVKTTENKRLFFLFPVRINRSIIVDATSERGKKIEEKKPWWSFFAF